MSLSTSIDVPTFENTIRVEIEAGTSIVFIGANGAGKTRLGVFFDQSLSVRGIEAHRIAAHRSLELNPAVVPPSLETAQNRLLYGYDSGSLRHKSAHRFNDKPATTLLSDFDHVLSALYAENTDVSILYRNSALSSEGKYVVPPPALIDKVKAIWEKLLPHRQLVVLGGNVKTRTPSGSEYSASEMSDGERVIFYLIAQALLAKNDTLLIFDEPELHINKSILNKLWDEIESARPDCCFLYITHDVDFAASRQSATKYVHREFQRLESDTWDIERVPENSQLPEVTVAKILGSRRPVLFVEGDGGSLDSALYRRVYQDFLVIPVGSCEQVITTVSAFATRPDLHRLGCAGLIDADGRTEEETARLQKKGVYCLPVSEVENVLLLPDVFLEIAYALMFSRDDARDRFDQLRSIVFSKVSVQIDQVCLRHTKRRVDADMKRIGLSGVDVVALDENFRQAMACVQPSKIFATAKENLLQAIASQDYERVLLLYDNKGLFSEAARLLDYQQKALEEFIGRALSSDGNSSLNDSLKRYLPNAIPHPRP